MNSAKEWQFDGLVGPTHNYAGLSFGNVASSTHAGAVSNPREAALQGLEKMRFVRSLGVPQAILPPRFRPIIPVLQQLGFGQGSSPEAVAKTLESAARIAPGILASVFSSSFMWAANAATVSPSADTADGRLHLTPANLVSNFHRSLEAGETAGLLKKIFHNEKYFAVHNFLPAAPAFADEGAANHMISCSGHGKKGVEIFVYGARASRVVRPSNFPARQLREAGEAIGRLHLLDPDNIIHVQQSPSAIDAGVFHNDVIAMNTTRLMIAHEEAFVNGSEFISKMKRFSIEDFSYIQISSSELSVEQAVRSYLFNSQLIDLGGGKFVLIAPSECEELAATRALCERWEGGNEVAMQVKYLNLRESMRNGGGPACLRLRVVMTDEESTKMHQGVLFTPERDTALQQWVCTHYRDKLSFDDLVSHSFIQECRVAYERLELIIEMPGLYSSFM
jgi:succinylarginine dihydrolase